MSKLVFLHKVISIIFLLILIIIINKSQKLDFKKIFVIFIRKVNLSTGGLLAYYYVNIGCVHDYILKGYIPIIDLISHPNIFNGFNTSVTKNPWEVFFNQPFNYALDIVKKKGEIIKYAQCYGGKKGPNFRLFENNTIREYWHKIASKYIPIKSEIIKEANSKFKLLFSDSINVLGVLMRGTDYIAKKPFGHAIPPTPKMVFEDIKKMDKKFKYNWIFLTTEDDLIREKFINKFKKKLKYIKSKTNINYDYKKKELLAFNKNIKGNLEYMKTYLINIIILSKCIDIITSKTAGAIVAFILTNGFRNKKIYDLGYYK
jgi:hypothetical protein